ncbi:MAG: hypothetical protein PHU25_04580 [Deltaproteobacteria bacterium]|nr:hypothetical protein [Deltaproteobacteria bacterium]
MRSTILLVALVALPFPAAAAKVAVLPVGYRLVGEGSTSSEKARMVEEQVAAAAAEAGFEAVRGAPVKAVGPCVEASCLPTVAGKLEVDQAVLVTVDESGALYEITVFLARGSGRSGQVTGPFAAALVKTRELAKEALETARAVVPKPVAPLPEPAPVLPPVAEQKRPLPTVIIREQALPAMEKPRDDTQRGLWIASWIAAGTGTAALVSGLVLAFVEDPCQSDSNDHGCKERLDLSTIGLPMLGVGAVVAAVGVAGVVLLDDDKGTNPASKAKAGVAPLPGGGAAAFEVEF